MLKPFSQNTDFQMTLITQQWHCKHGKRHQKKKNQPQKNPKPKNHNQKNKTKQKFQQQKTKQTNNHTPTPKPETFFLPFKKTTISLSTF